jgi:hypothetical protein
MTKAELRSLRQELEFKIEAMIHILDLIDVDADFEPYLSGFLMGPTDDREMEDELLEHDDEDSAVDDFPCDDEELDQDWTTGIESELLVDVTGRAAAA